MTKLKMGRHNSITAERFHHIKASLAEGMGDEAVMAKYEIKTTTLAYIKICDNFYEYRLRTETLPAARKMPKVIAPSSGLEFEDFSYRKKRKATKEKANAAQWQADIYHSKLITIVSLIGIAIVGVVAVVAMISLLKSN